MILDERGTHRAVDVTPRISASSSCTVQNGRMIVSCLSSVCGRSATCNGYIVKETRIASMGDDPDPNGARDENELSVHSDACR